MTWPSALESKRTQVIWLTLFRTKWTLPSAKQQLTPPVCKLRDIAEVMRLPAVVQPIPSAAF